MSKLRPLFVVFLASLGTPAAAQNLHVAGKVGIATTSPSVPLHVASCSGQLDCAASDASLGGGGYALFGDQTTLNLAFDNNEIMARDNSGVSGLYLNKDGGNVYLTMHAGTTIIGKAGDSRSRPLLVMGGNDINLNDSGDGFIQAGSDDGPNLVIDSNEIMARNASGPSATGAYLYLNYYPGGQVRVMTPLYVSSDRNLKKDIQAISKPLERITSLHGVTWQWKAADASAKRSMGVIAQDVEQAFPEIVSVDPDSGTKAVQYEALIGPMIEALKVLKADNEKLARELGELRAQVNQGVVR